MTQRARVLERPGHDEAARYHERYLAGRTGVVQYTCNGETCILLDGNRQPTYIPNQYVEGL